MNDEYGKYMIEIPIVPEVAAKIMQLNEDDESLSSQKLTELIILDPYLSASILKIANSALYSRRSEIKELASAVNLIGFKKIKTMILHDLRNPISVIKGYSDILQAKNNDPEKVKNYAASIQREAVSLNQLAGEMLDYSRGDIRLNLSITDLEELIDSVFSNIRRKILNDNIELEKIINFTGSVLLDYDRILRVLLNLCENSRKALYRGGKITIIVTELNDRCEIEVIDNGDGISHEFLDKIFDPFTSFSKAGGTGLGMVIVKNIIEAHEGFVSVESEENLGTTVHINLPLK